MPSLSLMACCGLVEISAAQSSIGFPKDGWQAEDALVQFAHYSNIVCSPAAPRKVGASNRIVIIGKRTYLPKGAHIIFSDAHDRTFRYGKRLAKCILKNKLGQIICTKQAPNPNYLAGVQSYSQERNMERLKLNSIHQITCYVWTVDHRAFAKFLLDRLPEPYAEGMEPLELSQWKGNIEKFFLGQLTKEQLLSHLEKKPTVEKAAPPPPKSKAEPKPAHDEIVLKVAVPRRPPVLEFAAAIQALADVPQAEQDLEAQAEHDRQRRALELARQIGRNIPRQPNRPVPPAQQLREEAQRMVRPWYPMFDEEGRQIGAPPPPQPLRREDGN